MKRLALLSAFLIAALLLGAAYPAFARGPELLHAQWQYPWL
jgi:hypothetical protein